jgi:hypothetical protein
MSRNQTYQNQNQNYRNRRDNTVKRFCAFIPDNSIGSKIGTLIKHTLPIIKTEVGSGIFIAFKNAEQANLHFDQFLTDHPELAKMTSMGPGWYFWSYTQDATVKAKAMLAAAASKWEDDRRAFEEKKARERDAREKDQRDSKPIMVEDLPASAFPPLAPSAANAKPVAAVWAAKGHAERKARADAPPAPVIVTSFVPLTRRDDMFEAPQKKTIIVGGWEQDDE